MPSDSTLIFDCPACDIHLTVPASLAGVRGPCPSCGEIIQAPSPDLDTELVDEVPVAPQSAIHEVEFPTDPSEPPPLTADSPDVLPADSSSESSADLTLSWPDPRLQPQPANQADAYSKALPERTRHEPPSIVHTQPSLSARILYILLPLLIVLLIIAAVFAIFIILSNRLHTAPFPEKEQPAAWEPGKFPPWEPRSSSAPTSTVHPPPSPSDGVIHPDEKAYAVLRKFLTARTLRDRLPLLETRSTESELAKSCLTSSLPTTSAVSLAARENHPAEQLDDWFYHVDIAIVGAAPFPATILVRKRGGFDPKVVVDPFLDSFGGRLAAFSAEPSTKAEWFQIHVHPVASCNDGNVPNNGNKLTLKLLAHENGREISRAYAGRLSRIGLMLEEKTRELRYDSARACTVVLRWNSEDDPAKPYLEAIDLKSPDWNP